MNLNLVACPAAGAARQLDAIDVSTASQAEILAVARAALELLEKRPRLLHYAQALGWRLWEN